MAEKTIAAIIVAAGTGSRSGLALPKQYARVGAQAVVAHAYGALNSHPAISTVIVVIGAGQEDMARQALGDRAVFVKGGAIRRDSVRAALEFLGQESAPDFVLIHDAARPFLAPEVIDRLICGLEEHQGAVPALVLADTIARGEASLMGEAVERDGIFRVQTPQAFHFGTILEAHRALPTDALVTDDAGMLRMTGIDVALVEGDPMLDKLTYSADFARAEAMLAGSHLPATGTGFDVHRLVPGKPLWLCGIEIAHESGLSGHSDADVAIHALVDALLGALAEGDIGSHFPPGDPQWKGASSEHFLAFARDRVMARAGIIAHVDVTIICEAPKIGPYRDVMRTQLAELLAIPVTRVSVKATTTERLGYTGRKEGIAAQAVATLLLPQL
jgi:2-C-methyl-D-erythritol 4-phosphate cytidylyltransferase/2-C-methyl-D-erythritol 2,4-cyclodiphosphate synthase